MRTLDRRLLRTIARSRLQFAAVAVVIAMGLMSFALMVNVYQNMDHSLWEYYRQQDFPHLFARFAPQPPGYLNQLTDLPGIARVEGRIVTDVPADVGRESNPVLRLVSSASDQRLNRPLVHDGHLPTAAGRSVALLARFAGANDLTVGDEIHLIIRGEAVRVTVSALVDSPEFIYAIRDVQAFMPDDANFGIGFADLAFMQDLLGMHGQVNEAVFLLHEGTDLDSARDRVEEHLKGRGLKEVITRDDQLSHFMISLELEMLEQFSQIVPVIFLAIAAAIIYMLISRLVRSDRTTIGVLKAMGYGNRQVLAHYLKYALLLGFTGAGVGMTLGYLAVKPMSTLYMDFFELPMLQTRIDGTVALWGILLTLAFCGGTGLWAARDVLGIVPADAMRPPAPPPGKRNLLEITAPGVWDQLSFGWKLVLRHIVRNKQRFALAVLGVSLTFAVVFMPFYMLGIINEMFLKHDLLEAYDYRVSFDVPVGPAGIAEIARMEGVDAVEPFLEFAFQVTRGWREENVIVRALPTGAGLQRFEDERGNMIGVPASGVLVSRHLAQTLQVTAGDEVILSSYITRDRDESLVVKAVVEQYLGSGMYVSCDQMQRLTGASSSYSGALIQSTADIRAALTDAGNVLAVFSSSDIIETFQDYMGLMIISFTALILIGGVLGFAILFNTASVNISERAREFSSMRVLGYRQHEVYRVLLRENILAWIAGTILGVPLSRAMTLFLARSMQTEMFYFPTLIHPMSYAVTAALVTVFTAGIMAAVWVRVRGLNLLEALSSRLT